MEIRKAYRFGLIPILALMVMMPLVASAQSEQDLKRYFEGQFVTVKLDMPATKDGVNVYPGRQSQLDYSEYGDRIKRSGVSLRAGDSIMVTKIKVKGSHIEFQLGGGGYGTMGDETASGPSYTPASKSRREKRLEDDLKTETDQRRRREIKDEIDSLRRERQREDRINEAIAVETAERQKARIERKALQGGSRFNIHFERKLEQQPATVNEVMEALERFIEFDKSTTDNMTIKSRFGAVDKVVYLKNGLRIRDVVAALGHPVEVRQNVNGDNSRAVYRFKRNGGRIVEAEFVNGLLVGSRVYQQESGVPLA
jgi:hypothetical protein